MRISESDELRAFDATGIYRLDGSGAAFLDPVRILNTSYRRFRLVPSAYYSRSFGTSRQGGETETERTGEASPERKKRKRKRKPKPRELNELERMAEARHQEARPLLLSAHKSLLNAKDLLEFLPRMIKEDVPVFDMESNLEKNLVELGSSWRAPFCEMTLCFQKSSGEDSEEDNYNQGYNLIVVDPPWENGCVRQKVAYPTLPNRHFLYLPVHELAHSAGALLVLWITNREKLWKFVEEELFPAWGVKDHTVFYWLKVKPDGSLIGNLDLLHHRPYECLLVGYINLNKEATRGSKFKVLEERRVIFFSQSSPMVEVERPLPFSLEKCICRMCESSSSISSALRVATLVRNGTRRWSQGTNPFISRRAEAVAPAADRDVQPDAADLADATVNPNDASAPARVFGTSGLSGALQAGAVPAQRLASEMPGLRPESPASPSPELRRVRTSFTGASSRVATTAMGKVVRAKAPAESKAKVEEVEKQRRKGKGDCDGTVSSARRRSPPPSPVSPELGKTRCSWITANSEPLYVAFHDEEWGVPVHDDQKLFELLTLSQALAELTWPTILNKRDEFREMFDGFNYASVSEFTDKKINLLSKSNGTMLLSEQKIRAVVTNAKQMHNVINDFGSFSNYCWSFVKHRPVKSNFRYARQVPIRTPKSEVISKDLMRRGFQCVGPTTIYSFMQVTGIVNDHLSCCFRSQDCRDIRAEPGLIERRLSSPPSSEDSETSREA
uniref:Uncharacterized protein n=1 Tax=Oryza punctata TaxID=4537 RepID=A0A0E0KA46_ORYPU